MTFKFTAPIVAALVLLAPATTAVLAQDNGLANTMWQTQKEYGWKTDSNCKKSPTSIVAFTECTGDYDGLCGNIAALNPKDSQLSTPVPQLTDKLNPDASLRKRNVIGIKIFANLKQQGNMLVGDGYSPCRGTFGKVCMRWNGGRKLEQWACLSSAGCSSSPGLLCTPKYIWTQVDGVPPGWVK